MYRLLIASAALAVASTAVAKVVPTDWKAVTGADLAGTPDLASRARETLNLKATGDFDGDRRIDRVSLRKNGRLRQYGVFACLARSTGPCVDTLVTSGPIAHLSNLGVNAVAATEPACSSLNANGRTSCIEVFAFEASSSLYAWNGSTFVMKQQAD